MVHDYFICTVPSYQSPQIRTHNLVLLHLSLSPPHSINSGVPVVGVHSSPGTPHILTHSHTLVKGWRVQQLYKCSAIIGRDTVSLMATTHPLVPTRLLATCKDSAVRLVCPVGGDVITTALLPTGQHITSLVYFSLQGIHHLIFRSRHFALSCVALYMCDLTQPAELPR